MLPIKEIADHLTHAGETHFNTKEYTVSMIESDEGFQYDLYPLGTLPDEDGEFDCDMCEDGGFIEEEDAFTAVTNLLEELGAM